MSILYINPLPKDLKLMVFNENKEVLFEVEKPKNNDEFSFFPELLVEIVKKYEATEIWCVVGPGPFTLMRIVTLAINSIAYSKNIPLKSCNFFDLVTSGHTPIIEANAREYLIPGTEGNIQSVPKEEITPGTYEGIISEIYFTERGTFIQYIDSLPNIQAVFHVRPFENRISPLYFKPPHITHAR